MWIKEVQVSNYARFQAPEVFKFARSRTAIVGQNNVGKSTLLKAISSGFTLNTNKDRDFINKNPSILNSALHLVASLKGDEILPSILRHISTGGACSIPLRGTQGLSEHEINRLTARVFDGEEVSVQIGKRAESSGGIYSSIKFIESKNMTFEENKRPSAGYPSFRLDSSKALAFQAMSGDLNNFITIVLNHILGNVFWFKAERQNAAVCASQSPVVLAPNCENLAAVIDDIQLGQAFQKIQSSLSSVIPTVKKVGSMQKRGSQNEREILVWSTSQGERDEGVSLADCGSGVGQVLAILTAAMADHAPRTLLIDEPNSFLHPAATKNLMSILSELKHHQIIIATHSMEALRAFDPETVVMLEARGSETIATTFKGGDLAATRRMLSDLGVSVADVTGADYCVWVEGQTEADVFPYLAAKLLPDFARRIVFPRVGTTGAFDGRRKRDKAELLQIYRNLSEAVVMMPSSTTFLFDREARSKEDRADLEREMKGKIAFLPRYCFENYLLDAEIIAEALKDRPGVAETALDTAKIEAWWTAHAGEVAYWPKGTPPKPTTDQTWRKDINAAKLLSDMVDDLSGGNAQYRKTADSVAIAKLLLDQKSEAFQEVADIIQRFLPKAAPG
jgi:ABC-type cobalamin/Fe3+-siderophores transport system ATPase subunit